MAEVLQRGNDQHCLQVQRFPQVSPLVIYLKLLSIVFEHQESHICLVIFIAYKRRTKRRSQGESKKENFDHATPMAVVLRAAAAQHRMRQAHSAEIYIRSVSSGLRASPYLVSTPATPEIHAAALLCLLRGDQQWDRARAPKRLKKKKKEKRRRGQNQETLPRPRERKKKKRARSRTLPAIQKLKEKYIFFVRRKKPQVVGV